MSFPYIAQIQVKDCYACQNLSIPHQKLAEKNVIVDEYSSIFDCKGNAEDL